MKLPGIIYTSIGWVNYELTRVDWYGFDVVFASLWQSVPMGDLNNTYVSFR